MALLFRCCVAPASWLWDLIRGTWNLSLRAWVSVSVLKIVPAEMIHCIKVVKRIIQVNIAIQQSDFAKTWQLFAYNASTQCAYWVVRALSGSVGSQLRWGWKLCMLLVPRTFRMEMRCKNYYYLSAPISSGHRKFKQVTFLEGPDYTQSHQRLWRAIEDNVITKP